MTDNTQADIDAAEAHFAIWYPDTAWGFDPLIETLARHRQHAYDQGYYDGCTRSVVQSDALRGANQALRRGLYGLMDSDDADTIATTLEAGGEVDWSEYPEGTYAALGHCGLELREKNNG